MKTLITFFISALLLSNVFAASISSRDVTAKTFIKVMEIKADQYSFAHCKVKDPNDCIWIGKDNFYSGEELTEVITRLKTRGTLMLTGEIAVITGLTAGAWIVALATSACSFISMFTSHDLRTFAYLTGTVALGLGVPVGSIVAANKVKVLNPTYPKKLAGALSSILEGEDEIFIKVEEMDYIAKLLGVTLDK